MAYRIFDFARDNFLLAGSAVAHPATVSEFQVMDLCKFEDVFFATAPVQLNARFLKNDF
jgi:hypothetical protein